MLNKVLVFVFLGLVAAFAAAQPGLNELDDGWNQIATEGLCSPGTGYHFSVRPVTQSADLLIYFNGGGACWFGQACDLNSQPNIHTPSADLPQNSPRDASGIFDTDHSANPLAGFNMVFLPYCTGDVFLGSGDKVYNYTNSEGDAVELTVHHQGYRNSMDVLNWVYANYPAPERIVIAGSSAGAIGSSFYAGLVAEHYQDVPVVLIADAAGAYGSPNLAVTFNAWETEDILPDWPEYEGLDNNNLTFEDFYIASYRHNENLTLSQYNTAYDSVQVSFTTVIGDPPDSYSLPQRLLNNYLRIESEVDDLFTYTAGGDVHTILRSDLFYQYEVQDVPFAQWVHDLVNLDSVMDVSCVREIAGCMPAPGQ